VDFRVEESQRILKQIRRNTKPESSRAEVRFPVWKKLIASVRWYEQHPLIRPLVSQYDISAGDTIESVKN